MIDQVDYSRALSDIRQVTSQLLGSRARKIDIIAGEDIDSNPLTRVEIDIEAKETHDQNRLHQLRSMLKLVFERHPELGNVHLIFRTKVRANSGSTKLGPDVSHIRRIIESLPS